MMVSSCTLCPVGFQQPKNRSASCLLCTPGFALLAPHRADGKGVKVDTRFYRRVLSPLYDRLVFWVPRAVSPNALTLLGGACCLGSIHLQLQVAHGGAGALYLTYCVLDNLDGKHARATGQTSRWGGVLDHCVDGFCSTPACALAVSTFLGLPLLPLFRLFAVAFFVTHVVEACTGILHMGLGSEQIGVDEVGLTVGALQLAISRGYSDMLAGLLAADDAEEQVARVLFWLCFVVLCMGAQLLWAAPRPVQYRKLILWLPVCLAIIFVPDYAGGFALYATFVVPLLVITCANGGMFSVHTHA